MKRIGFAICILFLSTSMCAQEYTIEEIKYDALVVLNGSPQIQTADRVSTSQKKIQSVTPLNRNSKPYLYIVNAADSAGWVLLSNEQRYNLCTFNQNVKELELFDNN